MEISPSVAIQIILVALAMLALVSAVFYFFANAEAAKKSTRNVSSLITLFGMIFVFVSLAISYTWEKKDTIFAALDCTAHKTYAPTKISCSNISPEYKDADWKVNGKPMPALDGALEFVAEKAGKYSVELTITEQTLFSENKASSSVLLVVGEKEAFEREVSETQKLFFSAPGTKQIQVDAPSGFVIDESSVTIDFQRFRGELKIVERIISPTFVKIVVFGNAKIGISGLKFRTEPSEGALTIAFTAKKEV